nr:MAG TPA: hypothetical protein [Caudoviricetes sp.]
MYPKTANRVHIMGDMYPKMWKWVHINIYKL